MNLSRAYKMLTFIVLIFVSTFSQAQTASVFVDVGLSLNAAANSNLCTAATLANVQAEDVNGSYDCSSLNGLTGGPYMFQDPVPAGNIITNIEVILYNDGCATTNTIDIADAMLMVMTTGECMGG